VPGSGSAIDLDFRESAGTQTGLVLPTGRRRDVLAVAGVGEVEVSVIDVSIPVAFIAAASLGATGAESHHELLADVDLRERATAVRRSGHEDDGRSEPRLGVGLVAAPADWDDIGARRRPAASCDVHVRAVSNVDVHKAFMGTGSVCAGVAASLHGTVVHDVTRSSAHVSGRYRLAHPSGVTEVSVELDQRNEEPVVTRAAFQRTARRMFDGRVYVPTGRLPWL
jgi:2-methylaconitate cis-trans-isomerase PrpF